MGYFVTGGTGFIGRHLVVELVGRGEPIWVLVRANSHAKFDRLVRDCGTGGKLLVPVSGDLTQPLLGVSAPDRAAMSGRIDHFFHLGALYDLNAADADLAGANVLGTRHALDLAYEISAARFHLVSSIAVAGRYRSTFTERMFGEAEGLDLPYFRTKHESEALVRTSCRIPWRIYRPGMVVGHSRTGAMDKIDGPYYLFKAIQKLRESLPSSVPLPGIEGGHVNLVPVDFVAAAVDHLGHAPAQDKQCFHLTDPQDHRVGDVLNLFARAAHAPIMAPRFEAGLWALRVRTWCGRCGRCFGRSSELRASCSTISAFPGRSWDFSTIRPPSIPHRPGRCWNPRGFGYHPCTRTHGACGTIGNAA